jgi:hypothetical protein
VLKNVLLEGAMAVYPEKGKNSRQTKEGGWKMLQGKNVTRKPRRTE